MGGGSDRIVLEGMRFFGHHGQLPEERALGTHLDVDVELSADLSVAGRTDDLADTIDYSRCVTLVRDVVEHEEHHLLETLAERIAATLLSETRAVAVSVRVAKQPVLPAHVRRCSVVIDRARQA